MFTRMITAAWAVWIEMAPYLLFGFLIAGMLSVWLSPDWVRRHLGHGWSASLRAALFGVPLPLCSCSIIPVAASLRQQGAGRGATAAFMMSTPQVGVNSIFVTYGLLGPVMTAMRAAAAFVSGLITGILVDSTAADVTSGQQPEAHVSSSCCRRAPASPPDKPVWRRILRHGFITLPHSIRAPLLTGITISALLGALLPTNVLTEHLTPGLPAMLLMMVIGVPLYVCSTSAVPVALMLIQSGLPAGAALVFLITGPATNAATLTTLHRLLGMRATWVYLGVLATTALLTGWLLDSWILVRQPDLVSCHAMETTASGWRHGFGIVLLAILLVPPFRTRGNR